MVINGDVLVGCVGKCWPTTMVPDHVTSVAVQAFIQKRIRERVTFRGSGNLTIGESAFHQCRDLADVVFPVSGSPVIGR